MDKIQRENMVNRVLGNTGNYNLLTLPFDKSDFDSNDKTTNFGQLTDMANDINKDSTDFEAKFLELQAVVRVQQIYNPESDLYAAAETLKLRLYREKGAAEFNFSQHGLSAFCSALGIPANYIRRCLEHGYVDLAAKNLNHWINEVEERDNFLRTTDGRLHGFLSSRYTVLDDHEILEMVSEVVNGQSLPYLVSNGLVTPELMKVRLVQKEKLIINGDELSVGFDVSNSRVGRSSVGISFLLYRWMCSNGMMFGGGRGDVFRRRHVGVDRTELAEELVATLDKMPIMIEYIKHSVEKAQNMKLNSETVQNLIDKFKAEGLSKNAAGRIEQVMDEKYERTLYGFVNSITELSKEYSFETREKMESFAGRIFERMAA